MIQFSVKFENQLSMAQVSAISKNAISKFGSCKPSSIMVSPMNGATFSFMQDCISAEELKNAVDKTLESVHETNPVHEIRKDGVHVWPVTN